MADDHTRRDLRSIQPSVELDLEIRLLADRRRDLTDEQTRRLSRLHDLLASVHPGLERACELTTKGGLWLVSRYVTPAEVRAAGQGGLVEHLQAAGGLPSRPDPDPRQPGSRRRHRPAAGDAGRTADRRSGPRARYRSAGQPGAAGQARPRPGPAARPPPSRGPHPQPARYGGRPGRRVHRPGRRPWPLRHCRPAGRGGWAGPGAAPVGQGPCCRPNGGNKDLKRVFYQSAFCSLQSPDSRAFYARKRREGKRHHQALLALARRRIDVLWAILHSRQPFQPHYKAA